MYVNNMEWKRFKHWSYPHVRSLNFPSGKQVQFQEGKEIPKIPDSRNTRVCTLNRTLLLFFSLK